MFCCLYVSYKEFLFSGYMIKYETLQKQRILSTPLIRKLYLWVWEINWAQILYFYTCILDVIFIHLAIQINEKWQK